MGKAQIAPRGSRARKPAGGLAQLRSAALDAAVTAILITDRQGNIVSGNPAFEQLSGYTVQELQGKTPRILNSGRQPTAFYEQMWSTILAGKNWQGELLNRAKDGGLYWEEMTIAPVRGAKGAIAHFVAVKQDVTGRRQAREGVHLLAQAVASATDMIALTDREGHFTFVNAAFEQAHRCSSEEIIGKHFGVVFSSRNPETLMREIGSQGLTPGGWKGECLLARLDGTDFPALLNVSPIEDEDGQPMGRVGIAQDISERKVIEARLRESEEQFRQISENLGEMLFILTPDPPKVNYVNQAYEVLWGRPRQELYENLPSWMESVHPEDRARMGETFARTLQGVTTESEFRLLRSDGSVRWVGSRSFPVTDAAGKLSRIVGIVEDITRRKQAEEEIRQAHARLNSALREAEQRAEENEKLTELVDVLQSCQRAEEAYEITQSALQNLLAVRSGALCITASSRNVVEAVNQWGEDAATRASFRPEDCWALRRGKVHQVTDPASALRCPHLDRFPEGGYLCVPLAAHGETLGILYLERPPSQADSPGEAAQARLARLASAVGERVSLALANLQLREALRRQSIHDSLTGLFNRRYMEESLERELSRAARNNHPVAMLMLDIDNFKAFNDTFGHQAGDTLLRAFGSFLNQRTRGQDVACRYGGEEFALILSGASLEAGIARAHLLRDELAGLVVEHAGQVLGKVTLSIGVAAFPEQGHTATDLLRSADAALYRAKADGRDRVISG